MVNENPWVEKGRRLLRASLRGFIEGNKSVTAVATFLYGQGRKVGQGFPTSNVPLPPVGAYALIHPPR